MFFFKKAKKIKEIKNIEENNDENSLEQAKNSFIIQKDNLINKDNIDYYLNLVFSKKQAETNQDKLILSISAFYEDSQNIEQAINILEQYLEINTTILPPKIFSKILALYNMKRKQYAEEKNNELLDFYLNKIDLLMAKSKNFIRN